MEIGELVKLKESSPAVNQTYRSLDRGKFDSEKNLAARNVATKVYYVESSESLSLSEFSKKNEFPSVLKVNEGQTALSHSFSFGSDQGLIRMGPVTIPLGVDRMFVALEKKLVEVATCKDLASKRTYTVPIKSCCIEVVPLHSAEWQAKGKKVTLFNFWKCRSLPKVVRAMKDFVTTNGRKICSGTLLFPREVKKKRKNGLRERALLAKVEDGSTVELAGDSGLCGTFEFSIDSSDIRISLVLAAQYCKLPFACTLQPCNDETFWPFRVNVERVEKSEVISGIMKVTEGPIQDDIYNCEHVHEVPVNLDLKVTVMKQKVERTAINAKPVPSSWMHQPDESASRYIEMIKGTALVSSGKLKANAINSKVPGSSDSCTQLDSSNDQHNRENHPKYSEEQKPSIPSVVFDTAMLDPPTAEMMTEVYCDETLNVDCDKSISIVEEEHDYSSLDEEEHIYSSIDEEEHPYGSIEEAAEYEYSFADKKHFQKLNEYTVESDRDLSYDDNNEYTYISAESDREFSDNDYDTVRERTRRNVPERKPDEEVNDCTTATTTLKSLDVTGVLRLLDAMNLGMYKESFKAAMIDGNVFSRLNDDRLSQLGVTLSLHRLRLLHIVKGVKTVESIFSTPQSTSGEQNCPQELEVANDARVNKTTERTPSQQATNGGECDRKECQHQVIMQTKPLHEVDTPVSVPGGCVKAYDEAQFIKPLVGEDIVSVPLVGEDIVSVPFVGEDIVSVPLVGEDIIVSVPLVGEDIVSGGITSIPEAIDRPGTQCVSNLETYDILRNAHLKTIPRSNVHGTSTTAKSGWHFNSSDQENYKPPRPSTSNRSNTVSSLISKFEVAHVRCGHAPDKTLEKEQSIN